MRTVLLMPQTGAVLAGLLMAILLGCGLTGTTLVSTRTVQAALTATLSAEPLTALLATMTLDLVGRVPFTCPTVTPTTPGAASYTFDFGGGCEPNPAVLVRDTVSGRARVEVNGSRLSVAYDNTMLHGVTLNGVATVTVSGPPRDRVYRFSGRYPATVDGKAYDVAFSDLAVRATANAAGEVSLVINGASSVDDHKGTLSISAANLSFSDHRITGSATLSTAGGYFAVAAVLGFERTEAGVKVSGTVVGIPFSFDYAL